MNKKELLHEFYKLKMSGIMESHALRANVFYEQRGPWACGYVTAIEACAELLANYEDDFADKDKMLTKHASS